MKISIIGCGYVGLVTGACLAELGHEVLGIDNNKAKIRKLKALKSPIYEPGLEELLISHCQEGRLRFSGDIAEGVRHGDIIFICVNTPPKEDGTADLSFVEAVSKEIARNMTKYRLIVEKSTVPVKTGEWVARTIAENIRPGIEFDVASNPEFLREGTAINDFLHPDRVVIGISSQRARSLLTELYEPLNAPLLITDINSAELIKHSANAFLALKISFINSVASICSAAGADIKKVTKGIGLDRRIGMASMEAGIGYGGFCLPKDVSAFIGIARSLGCGFEILEAAERVNNRQRIWPVKKLQEILGSLRNKRIAVLGLSFKPFTDDIRFAPALDILASLHEQGAEVRAYDPQAMTNMHEKSPRTVMCQDAYSATADCDAMIICTEWPEFKRLNMQEIKKRLKRPLIIDGRNIFEPARIKCQGFEYFCVGRPSSGARPQS